MEADSLQVDDACRKGTSVRAGVAERSRGLFLATPIYSMLEWKPEDIQHTQNTKFVC